MSEPANKSKKIVDRSPAYPSIDLEAAVGISTKLFDIFSEYSFSRESAVDKLGIGKSSANWRKIAALVQFGLLSREGNSYKISPLAKDIALVTDEGLKYELLSSALLSSKIYTTIVNENNGKTLPSGLDNRLRQLDYSKEAAKTLAKLIKMSLEYSKLLQNGIVSNSVNKSDEENFGEKAIVDKSVNPQNKVEKMTTVNSSNDYINYPLDNGIILMFPNSMLRKLVAGVFLEQLEKLEQLGKEEHGKSTDNASDSSME